MKTMVALKDAQPLDMMESNALIAMIIAEMSNDLPPQNVHDAIMNEHYTKVLQKRIEVCKLPIAFNIFALGSIPIFCDRIGGVVVLLIDCLECLDNTENSPDTKEINLQDLCSIYPCGFYKEGALFARIDQIKTKKNKWDFLY